MFLLWRIKYIIDLLIDYATKMEINVKMVPALEWGLKVRSRSRFWAVTPQLIEFEAANPAISGHQFSARSA